MTPAAQQLRREYGPAPWWDRDRLRELLVDRGLTSDDVASVWNVHAETVESWARRHGIARNGGAARA